MERIFKKCTSGQERWGHYYKVLETLKDTKKVSNKRLIDLVFRT